MKTDSKLIPAEIRQHYWLPKQVVIAPKRSKRPRTLSDEGDEHKSKSPPLENDPALFELIDNSGKWLVKVIDNLYPAFSLDNPKAYGKQEIVLESPLQGQDISKLPKEQLRLVFQAYQTRLEELRKLKGIKYISIFKNKGHEAGASLNHTHSQIIATGTIPAELRQDLLNTRNYQRRHRIHPLSHALRWELHRQVRIIEHGRHFTSFCPYFSQHPYEAWVVPNHRTSSITEFSPTQLTELADHLQTILRLLERSRISFNYHLHEPVENHLNYWYLTIAPRPNIWAGFELNTGMIINPVSPETAAQRYRNRR